MPKRNGMLQCVTGSNCLENLNAPPLIGVHHGQAEPTVHQVLAWPKASVGPWQVM
jgi:hypothetical protein